MSGFLPHNCKPLLITWSALHLFGKDAFFQPYLPLQQVESLRAPTWLVGSTNQIVTQQRDCKYDVLVNVRSHLATRVIAG